MGGRGHSPQGVFDFNEIHWPQQGPQMGLEENMQVDGVRYATTQIWSNFREILGENPADLHL